MQQHELIGILRDMQGNKSVGLFARSLGLHPQTIYAIYEGRRKPGRRILRALLGAYPQCADRVAEFVKAHPEFII